jgi:cell division protein FtsB
MRSGEVALRISIVLSVAGFITLAAGLYEIDRREKSSSDTVAANLAEIEQRVQILSNQIRLLNDQYTMQLTANERRAVGTGLPNSSPHSPIRFATEGVRGVRQLESAPARH